MVCTTSGVTTETVPPNCVGGETPSWSSAPSAIPSPLIPVLSHPSHSRTPQFLVGPHEDDIVLAPQKHQPLPAPLCPTLPKPFLAERWDFGELFGGFGFFFSLLLILGFVVGFPGRRSEQELLISGNQGPAAAYKQFRSGQVEEGSGASWHPVAGTGLCY